MPFITPNLRLLFSSSSSSSSLFPLKLSVPLLSTKPTNRHHSLFTILSYSKRQRSTPFPQQNQRRNRSTFKKEKDKEDHSMEESAKESSFGFNKRRAEGRVKDVHDKKKLQLKVRKLNPINTLSYVQILGTGMDTQDTSPSVLLFFDNQRFIFNAGEGLQRFCTEHKIKLSKVDHIFLSRVCSETAGGLPGLLLTLAGIGDEGLSVNVWGPSDLKYLVDAMKSFIPHAAMVHTHCFGPAPSSDASPLPDSAKSANHIILVDNELAKILAILLKPSCSDGSPVKPGETSVIYVCELPEITGKFDPKKAVALGLKSGPKYRELQSGKSVKSDTLDIMVHPSDVLGPSLPGPIVLLVDCPTESHVLELLSAESLNSYYADFSGDPQCVKTVNCIIHLSPVSVTGTSNYQKWMKRFGSAQHIMAGHETKNVEIPILKASARITTRLNYLCPQLFPASGFWSLPHFNTSAAESSASEGPVPSICAENLLKFTLRPLANLGIDRTNIPSLEAPSEITNELLSEVPEVVDAAHQISQFWQGPGELKDDCPMLDNEVVIEEPWLDENRLPNCLDNVRRDDLEIVLLGTGSSQPSKYRNVSSIYVNLFSKGSLLLDCGEGTLGQLKRRYGVEGADSAVRTLRFIWISHIHADHHAGLARILALRRDLLKGVPHEPLLVVGPGPLKRYLDAYERLEDLDMQFLHCRYTREASWNDFEGNGEPVKNLSTPGSPFSTEGLINKAEANLFAKGSCMQSVWKGPGIPVDNNAAFPLLKNLKKVLNEAGLETLISFPVVHCPQAFGFALKAAERINSVGKVIPGWKIVYSGDTRPCPELVEASRGATVLIHEATFEDGMMEEAIAKNHSTTKEAIDVGSSAGVYRIILTHFSQRYPKIPVVDESQMHKTCIAFDLMSINLADLPILPKVLPYFKLLFKDEMPVDESDDVVDAVSAAS